MTQKMPSIPRELLAASGLFRGIDPEAIPGLLSCLGAREQSYVKGGIIWCTGDVISRCALVLSGQVRAESVSISGKRSILALHREGALVGDILMSTPAFGSPVELIAAEDSCLLFLPFESIMGGCEKACDAHRTLRCNLVAEIAGKYWAVHRKLQYLCAPTIRQRLARRLLDEAKATGRTTFSLGCSREELADFLEVNRSALSRELGNMRREGLIDNYRDSFKLLDLPALERAAQ